MPLYLGLSQWSHAGWPGNLLSRGLKTTEHLSDYARVFNTVEGNTSFYGVPDTQSLTRWEAMTGDDFRFTFKFPSTVSHQGRLADNIATAQAFLDQLTPLHHKLGMLMLQLPAATGPEQLDGLAQLLDALPNTVEMGVEVRHPAFFAKGKPNADLTGCCWSRAPTALSWTQGRCLPWPPPRRRWQMPSRKSQGCRCTSSARVSHPWCDLSATRTCPPTPPSGSPGCRAAERLAE
ncbi:DUF72 domain-containing protein [Oceanimonas sp. NS1]|nr:DUF72 domain-containing protein [Oceanimonas sp. NS1]